MTVLALLAGIGHIMLPDRVGPRVVWPGVGQRLGLGL